MDLIRFCIHARQNMVCNMEHIIYSKNKPKGKNIIEKFLLFRLYVMVFNLVYCFSALRRVEGVCANTGNVR